MPFARHFFDDHQHICGEVHEIAQGEGGDQGDPLMPLLFILRQHVALAAANARLQDRERLFAQLDDIYVMWFTTWESGKW